MIWVHMILGVIVLLLAIIATLTEIIRTRRAQDGKNPLRGPLIGLADLQVLLGIVTLIVQHSSHSVVWYVFHPVLMIAAVILLHGWTKAQRPSSSRVASFVISTILFLIGAIVFY